MRVEKIVKKPKDFEWSKIPMIPIDYQVEPTEAEVSAIAQICYDEEALYVRLSAKEKHIRAEYTGPLDMPCQDSCLEFFFSPMEGNNRYFNIEFNPNCCVYLGIGSCLQDLVRLLPEGRDVLWPKAERTEDGWNVTYHIPASFIRQFFPGFVLESGKAIRANFYKTGDLTVEPHNFSWNPIAEGEHSFHRPCDFGVLELE